MSSFLVDHLLEDPRGVIILCNIIDGISVKLYTPQEVKNFFLWWGHLCHKDEISRVSGIISAMDQIGRSVRHRTDLLPGIPRPEFFFYCNCSPWPIHHSLSWVIPAHIFGLIICREDMDRLASKGVIFPSGSGDWDDAAVAALIDLSPEERSVRLDPDKTLGLDILWVTWKNDTVDQSGDADRARDALGLIHHQARGVLVAVHFDAVAIGKVKSGRPTFMDAGSHSRFRTLADSDEYRQIDAWGRTVDLSRLAKRAVSVDGLPERVCAPIPSSALADSGRISFTPLGRLSRSCDQTPSDHQMFADRLRAGRSIEKIKSDILEILT